MESGRPKKPRIGWGQDPPNEREISGGGDIARPETALGGSRGLSLDTQSRVRVLSVTKHHTHDLSLSLVSSTAVFIFFKFTVAQDTQSARQMTVLYRPQL